MPSFDASSKTGPDISKEVILKLQLPRNNFNIKCAHKFLLFNKKRIRNIEFESPILSLRDEVAKQGKATGYQRCTHRVLQRIQMKPILLCVWEERAVLGSTKTALEFKHEIQID